MCRLPKCRKRSSKSVSTTVSEQMFISESNVLLFLSGKYDKNRQQHPPFIRYMQEEVEIR